MGLGTLFFFLLEYNNTLAEHRTLFGKLATSFFGVVTPRTAGFNQVNVADMLLPTTLMTKLLMWIGASSFAIMMIEPTQGLLNIAFEVVLAYGTVGLSRGITSSLTDASKVILIITMFLGRVTMLTFLTAFFKKVSGISFRFPEEDILIN